MTPSEIADWHEAEAHKYPKDGIGFRGHMKKAATIRAQAEALKIATEALENISKGNRGQFESGDHMAFDKLMCAAQALARIKEVG